MSDRWMRYLLVAFLLGGIVSCDTFSLFGELENIATGGLSIIPSSVIVNVDGFQSFTAIGGAPPYDFRITSGSGTIVLSGDASGNFTAPSGEGLTVIELLDSTGSTVEARVNVLAPTLLTINPSTIWINTGDTFTFSAYGGTGSYTYSVSIGTGSFPIPSSGLYQAPLSSETSSVQVTDGVGVSTATVNVVSSGGLGINPTPAKVAEGTTFQFNAYGGTPAYSFTVDLGVGVVNSSTGLYNPGAALPGDTADVKVTDTVLDSVTASVTVVPAKPTNLVADGTFPGPQDIRLTWNDNSAGETGYEIWRKDGGAAFLLVFTTGPNVTTYDDLGLVPNTPYTYKLRAVKTGAPTVYSAYSNMAFDISNS
jgi:hypothetical protein